MSVSSVTSFPVVSKVMAFPFVVIISDSFMFKLPFVNIALAEVSTATFSKLIVLPLVPVNAFSAFSIIPPFSAAIVIFPLIVNIFAESILNVLSPKSKVNVFPFESVTASVSNLSAINASSRLFDEFELTAVIASFKVS